LANQEVGALQPVRKAAVVCRDAGVLMHVDATAAAGLVDIDFDALGADLMSVSCLHIGGPRGIAALLVRKGLRIDPLLLGGSQERARRAGLENNAAAVGCAALAQALAAGETLADEAARAHRQAAALRDVAANLEGVRLYGPEEQRQRLPGLVCVGFEDLEAEPVLIGLNQRGVAAHSGSSCSSELLEPSPVLAAMGADSERSLRLSVGWNTTDAEIDFAGERLVEVVDELRHLRAAHIPVRAPDLRF
jgi:cysteine desulfurase